MHLQLPVDKIIRRNATKLSSLVAHLARGQLALALSSERAGAKETRCAAKVSRAKAKQINRSLARRLNLSFRWSFFFA